MGALQTIRVAAQLEEKGRGPYGQEKFDPEFPFFLVVLLPIFGKVLPKGY